MSLLMSQPRIDFSAPILPVAVFDPPVIGPGQESVYRVNINALEASIDWPPKLTAPPQLALRPGGRGQLLQMAGGNMEARTTFNFHARPTMPGDYAIPQFKLLVYGKSVTIPAAHLVVTPAPSGKTPLAQKLGVDVPDGPLYVGQAIKVRVTMQFAPGALQTLSQVQLNGEGFLVDQTAARQMFEPVPLGSPGQVRYVYEIMLTPIAPGTLTFFAQGFTANRVPGTGFAPGAVPPSGTIVVATQLQYTLLDSDPVQIQVRALPREGELPGFTGAIGSFSNEPPRLSTNYARVGDPLKLTVTIRGDGDMVRLVPPPPPKAPGWQVFPAEVNGTSAPLIHMQGASTFAYTLVPFSPLTTNTPRIPFSFFDAVHGHYKDLTIPSVPVTIAPGPLHPDLEALALRERADANRPEPVLTGRARTPGLSAATLLPVQQRVWFPLVQVAPAILVCGLWGWDRRRRYLEAHPHIVLCRRARRIVRRERRAMRRAQRAADSVSFANAARAAFQAAVAPHYPARAEALVGVDVLPQLADAVPESTRLAVRKLFTVSDANRYGTMHGDQGELLLLDAELQRALELLEEELCV